MAGMGISHRMSRREFCRVGAAAAVTAASFPFAQSARRDRRGRRRLWRRSCARALQASIQNLQVTLIEPNNVFTACPFSNEVIAGLRESSAAIRL
jgi:hypothetical protein